MLTHVVLFKLKDRRDERVAEAKARLEALDGAIPSLRSLEVGTDVLHSGRSYDIAVIARFDDMAGLEAYQVHPAHLPVLDYMREAAEASVAVDFES